MEYIMNSDSQVLEFEDYINDFSDMQLQTTASTYKPNIVRKCFEEFFSDK